MTDRKTLESNNLVAEKIKAIEYLLKGLTVKQSKEVLHEIGKRIFNSDLVMPEGKPILSLSTH